MQFLLNFGIVIYCVVYGFEAVIRYGLHLINHDNLIFIRDAFLAVPLGLIFVHQILRQKLHPAFLVYLFVVVLHGLIMVMNTGSYVAVAYGAKLLMGMLAGALASRLLFQPSRSAVLFFFLLWLVTAAGVVIDKFGGDLPWTGLQTTIGDITVDISYDWQIGGDDKRAAGFTRSSINAASLEPLLALLLIFHLRRRLVGWLVAAATLPVLYWTTQKGAILAYGLTLGFICLAPKRPLTALRPAFFLALALAIGLPLILPEYNMPSEIGGPFSLASFYLRVNDMWPRAWRWISRNDVFPFGVGLGGIGGAQRLYAPYAVDYADNIFLFVYAWFGMMALFYFGWLVAIVLRLGNGGPKAVGQAMATLVFLMFYGVVLSILEDQMDALFIGGAAVCLAQEVRSRPKRGAERYQLAGNYNLPGELAAPPAAMTRE